MDEAAAAAMARLINVVRPPAMPRRRCARRATTPRWCSLVAVMQNLGRLLVQYHFPDEAEQIRQLMQPLPPKEPDTPPQPGLSEESAAVRGAGRGHRIVGAAWHATGAWATRCST